MPDRIEREIEDILNKLDDFVPDKGQKPVPLRPRKAPARQPSLPRALTRLSLNQIMLYALIGVIGAFFLRALPFASWVMMGSLIVLAVAFVMSMRQGGRGSSSVGGSYQKRWRGEPIDLSPPAGTSLTDRIKGWFGRGRR